MTRDEQQAVCAEYGLGEPLAFEALGGTRNRNFLLKTTGGKFVLRDRYVGYRDPLRISFDHEALNFLHARKVAVVPPTRTKSGETFWRQGDRLWEVFPAVTGRHFRDGDAGDIRALARALAAFHGAGARFLGSDAIKLGPRGETDPAELSEIIPHVHPDAPVEVQKYVGWMITASRALTDSIYASLPATLIHGDVQPANILIDAGEVRALVDLDWCGWGPRIYDLAFAILLCCATHETPIDGGDIWSLSQPAAVKPDLARLFLNAYEDHGLRLAKREVSALRPQVILSWCHVRLAGAMKVEPARRAEFLARPPHDLPSLFPDGIT